MEVTNPQMAVLRCYGRNSQTWEGPHWGASERFNWDYFAEELSELAAVARDLDLLAQMTYVIFNNNMGSQAQRNATSLKNLLQV